LEPAGTDVNCVEFGTANGETMSVAVLLSKTNVTVCGSATADGLSHVMLCPTPTCTSGGTNTANISVEVPPPACTDIDDDGVVELLLLLLAVSCALMTLKLVVAISSEIDSAAITATAINMDFITIYARNILSNIYVMISQRQIHFCLISVELVSFSRFFSFSKLSCV
jgi:hypothetical protein